MAFGDFLFEESLPPYLLLTDKTKIKKGLSQFFEPQHRQKEKVYDNFYLEKGAEYFMQGDLINSIPMIEWNSETGQYETGFSRVLLMSNSCDVAPENNRLLDKEALFAPVIPLTEYFDDLREDGCTEDNIMTIYNNLKSQQYTNLFYLPPDSIHHNEYVVFFDKVNWHPSTEFQKKLNKIHEERFLSLDHFGFYLLITKISFHFCRVPEEKDR